MRLSSAAQARDDLPYLRRRSRRSLTPPAAAPQAAFQPAAVPQGSLPPVASAPVQATANPLDLSDPPIPAAFVRTRADPGPANPLDLSEPTTPPGPPTPTPPGRVTSNPPGGVTADPLDLSDPPAAPAATGRTAPAATGRAAPAATESALVVRRVAGHSRTIFTPSEPTVTLTRTQSAIGQLIFEAACSDDVGDLRLGCAYELSDGYSATVEHGRGIRFGPPNSSRPVIVGQRQEFERISIDLRQCQRLRRLAVYAFSPTHAVLRWGGTGSVSTFGQARIEVPLDLPPAAGVLVLWTLYNVAGQFVLRAEMDLIAGGAREACRAFGYDHITWVDADTPLV